MAAFHCNPIKKYNLVLALIKTVRKTLFRTIAIGVKTMATVERDQRFTSEYGKDSRGFPGKEQNDKKGVDGTVLGGDINARGILVEPITGFPAASRSGFIHQEAENEELDPDIRAIRCVRMGILY